jgi:hypothetical protein
MAPALALPYRGDGSDRPAGLVLPPARMPLSLSGRPLKQWRYVGVYGSRLMLCVGVVRIGPLPQVFWAVWDRERQALRERTRWRGTVSLARGRALVRDGGVAIDLVVDGSAVAPVETISPHGDAWIWTRKQAAVRVAGVVSLDGERIEVDELGCTDDSAGYHARSTAWEWSAGVGALTDGRAVGWNLVTGVHDADVGSERSVWVDGAPVEVPPVVFGDDLSSVSWAGGASLAFSGEATRARHDDLRVFRSDYTQPFGTFTGTLPGNLELAEGRGVMERHSALW